MFRNTHTRIPTWFRFDQRSKSIPLFCPSILSNLWSSDFDEIVGERDGRSRVGDGEHEMGGGEGGREEPPDVGPEELVTVLFLGVDEADGLYLVGEGGGLT